MNKEHKNEKSAVAQSEESVLSFWNENQIFEKSLEKNKSKGKDFVFYDGPPFATGLPHYGHLLAGTIKDIIPRYKTMQGFYVPRKWGWDCHGLPIELLIEKELGLNTRKDVEDYGIGKFNTAARNSVLRYESEWKRYVPRSGRFVDMENAYMAMDAEYMESIWWVFGELNKKGLTKEGFKPMHLCPRCETTLANFEVNQGYKDVTDISVTAKFELVDEENTYLLAWTTTPWTLPGNVALAVGEDIDYVKVKMNAPVSSFEKETNKKVVIQPVKIEEEFYIVAKELLDQVFEGKEYKIMDEQKGTILVGKKYKPLFDYYQNDSEIENTKNGWQIYAADFVTTEDGTGIVHIAPAFGSDDMQLGKDNNLPFVQHVAKNGQFKDGFAKTTEDKDFNGMFVKQKDDLMSTDIEIIKRLAHDGKLFDKKKLVHSYPHCWRCETPLLNYATTSWYVTVPEIKDQLVKSNKKVHWVPEHVGEGRFGKWLDGARDWALSRSRFWGTPLPVWNNPETEENVIVGSYDELYSLAKKSGNKYFAVRHGEAESNLTGIINADPNIENPLTDLGRKQITDEIKDLKDKNIDLIFVSPFKRTQETAKMIAEGIGISDEFIITDNRIRERNPGKKWEGRKWEEFWVEENKQIEGFFDRKVELDSESLKDIYIETTEFLFEINKRYQGKNILIVSHGGTIKSLKFTTEKRGLERYAYEYLYLSSMPKNADVLELNFIPFPHNKEMELDIHRPYIDDFEVEQNGVKLERVKDVFDVWFDSGSMPYAQSHYPFENKKEFEKTFPAQFIAEGLDQTRGWFYVLTVLGNALFGKTPFENVIVNGMILAEDGKKMSKSLNNFPDPYDMFDSVGADAVRLYMINSPVVRAEEFAFSEKGVREVSSKVMGRLRNTMSLYKMYAGEVDHSSSTKSKNVLDLWIISRTEELLRDVTESLDNYELDRATRPIFDFVDDFSTWYVRRSRDRYKGDDNKDKKQALETTRYVFETVSKIIAPFVPFVAEELWQDLRQTDETLSESVHLVDWPKSNKKLLDNDVLIKMNLARNIISLGLKLRSDLKIKVRQPLQSFSNSIIPELETNYHNFIIEELNVKQLLLGEHTEFNTELTPELIAEGNMRELLRAIQKMRKDAGLDAHDVINLVIQTSSEGQKLMEEFNNEIKKTAGIREFNFTHNDGDEIKVADLTFIIAIEK